MRRTLDIMRRDDGNVRDGISGGGSAGPPPVSMYYIQNADASSCYRGSTGAGFRGSSTSTTAVVVYIDPTFTAASGVLGGYGTVSSTGHSWDFQIFSDGSKYSIRPRLRTTSGQELGPTYRIQASDLGTILTCVATFDGTYLRFYVNGCEVGMTVITGTYTPGATQRMCMLNNNLLTDPVLNTEKVGIVAMLTANSILTPSQINTWHNETIASVDGDPPVFPGGVTVNRWVASDAYDDAQVGDAANGFLDTVGSVTLQQVVAETQTVTSVLASAYSTEVSVPAFRLTGANNFEEAGHAIGQSATPWTVNLLAHFSTAPNVGTNEGVLSYRQNGSTTGWGIRRINSTGAIDCFAFNSGGTLVAHGTQFTTTAEAVKHRTHLVTFSHDGTDLRMYVNGAAVGAATACGGYNAPAGGDSLAVGDTAGTNLPFLSGNIVGFSIVEGTAWGETEHDALWTLVQASGEMEDDATYPATEYWKASSNLAVGDWEGEKAADTEITKVGTPVITYVAKSRMGSE